MLQNPIMYQRNKYFNACIGIIYLVLQEQKHTDPYPQMDVAFRYEVKG
jgi:hypothetical protein